MAGQPKTRVKEAAANRCAVERRAVPAWQDEDLVTAICEDLAVGCSMEVTGLAHGLGNATLGRWAKDALDVADRLANDPGVEVKADPMKVLAGMRLLRAHASASQGLERRMHTGEVWALEILARRHRHTWGRMETLNVGAADNAGLATLLGRLGDPEPVE